MHNLLMPKATAVWLVENTSLTFDQIADFTKLHPLEIKSLADEEYGVKIKGLDPVATGQLTREEIRRCQDDPKTRLRMIQPVTLKTKVKVKKKKYTPITKRQHKPDAIHWLLKNHPELNEAQICRLIGTTKTTIESIKSRTHWNSDNLKYIDPVVTGFCTQTELDEMVRKSKQRQEKFDDKSHQVITKGDVLDTIENTLAE